MNARQTHQTGRKQTVFVGSKIRQIRKERGLTQAVLASRVGVQQSDLCRMENGEYKVSLDALFKILGVFGLKIGDFFDDENAPVKSREQEILEILGSLDQDSQEEVLAFVRFKLGSKINSSIG